MRRAIILMFILVLAGIPSVISASGFEEDMSIKLKIASFDPIATGVYGIAKTDITSYPPSGTGAYIVQFKGPVKEEWKQQLKGVGKIHGYIPEYAFIVEMNGTSAQEVENLDFVRWVGVYQPSYKISPSLRGITDDFVFIDILVFDNDNEAVISTVKRLGGTAGASSPGKIFASINPSLVPQVAGLNSVRWIETHSFFKTYNNVSSGIMNASVIWTTYGMNGSGQIVAVADTGLDIGEDNASMHYDFQGRIVNITSWPIDSSLDSYINNLGADDGAADLSSGHGTHVAGSVLGDGNRSGGNIKGTAYGAGLMFQAVEQYVAWKFPFNLFLPNYSLVGIPSNLTLLFQQAYDNNARIHTNSWGALAYGNYTSDASTTDAFVWNNKDMVILFAAGNAGTDSDSDGMVDLDSIGSPGTAKNIITVGASENDRPTFSKTYGETWPSDFPANPIYSDKVADDPDGMVAFSSRGPTDDNRIKPDVVAPGTYILSTRSSVASGTLWGAYNSYYTYSGGTSMSTPLTAGAVALIRQYYVENRSHTPNASLIKATLINGAYDMPGQYTPDETGTIPNYNEGWGRVDLKETMFPKSPKVLEFSDSEYALLTGESHTYYYEFNDTSVPLKMTLVWTDYPGDPVSSVALVNDLDLVVISPSGEGYHGNDFSSPYNDTRDNRNNVEQVRIDTPEPGNYTVIVKAVNVPQGPQDFSLVVSGGPQDITPPSITIHSPKNITYNTSQIQLNVSADEDISTWIYNLNSAGNQTFTPNTTITALEGPNNITVYANDSADNRGFSIVYFTVTLPVHNDTGYNFSTIQEAIDNSINGSNITVDAVTLTENVDINKPINLIGAGAGLTIVQAANSSDHVFDVTANGVNVSGFTVRSSSTGSYGIILDRSNNSFITDLKLENNSNGLWLYYSSNNTISSSTVTDNINSITLTRSRYNLISSNTISNNSRGIEVYSSSSNNTITSNIIYSNTERGINLENSDNNTIQANNISKNEDGIYLALDSGDNKIENNTIDSNTRYGVKLQSSGNLFTNNTFSNNQYNLYFSTLYLDQTINTSNNVNGKPVYYLKNIQNAVYDSTNAGFFACIDCINIIIANLNLSNNYQNILLYNTNDSIIQNNIIGTSNWGIDLRYSSNNTISGNSVSSKGEAGIQLKYTENNTIIDNNLSNNSDGIYLFQSTSNNLVNNTANSNDRGTHVHGIHLYYSSSNMIINNNVSNNQDYGIYLISSSSNNTIYHNNLINNTNQAYDNGTNNTWDSGSYLSGGNYWSDWTSPDKNKDGVVDRAYNITGGSSQDRYPVTSENGWNDIDPSLVVDVSPTTCLPGKSYYTTIKSAVNDLNAGTSRIYVCEGNYTENMDVDRPVELFGAGMDVVTVSASNSGDHVFNVTANWVNISGFTVTGANGSGKAGIYLNANYSNISDNNASDNYYGIYLYSSNSNTLTNSTLSSNQLDFYSTSSSNNTIITNRFSNTKASFTYSGNISINTSSSPGGRPQNLLNISKYLNVTNTSSAWLYLNISYIDTDLGAINESTLKMYRYNGTAWSSISGTNGVDTSNNYVYANLTSFSIFASMGKDNVPPDITITSPETKTYTTNSISLNFTVQDKSTINWTGYSLDSGNITTTQNTTLTGLSNGQHNVTVYANDTYDNWNSSTVLFTISVSAPKKQSSRGGGGGGGGQTECITEGFQEMSADLMNCIINKLNLRYKKFYDVPITAAATYIQNSDKTLGYPAPTYASVRETLSNGVTTIEEDNIDIYSLAAENTLNKLSYTDSILLARGDLEADSIAAVAYAKANNMPILLTTPDELPQITRDTIEKLGPKRVTIVGGPVAVSSAVEAELKGISTVKTVNRIAGADRSETAVEIAKGIKAPDTIVIADGYDKKLEAVFIANAYKAPIVYVTGDEVPRVTKDYLKANRLNTKYRPMKVVFVKISDKAKGDIKDIM